MQMLVAGWKALGMVERGDFVGIMGFASMDWLVSDIATTHTGGVMSPLPTNILVEDIKHLILEAEVGVHSPQPMPVQHRPASLEANLTEPSTRTALSVPLKRRMPLLVACGTRLDVYSKRMKRRHAARQPACAGALPDVQPGRDG